MASLNFTVTTAGKFPLAATSAQTALVINAPTHQRVKIKGFSISGFGIVNTDTPIEVELLVCSAVTGGTAGTAPTVSAGDGDVAAGETVQTTATGNYTAEPSTYTITSHQQIYACHPQTGLTVYYPLGEEIILKGGTILTVRLTPNQAESVVVNVYCEE